MKFLSAQENLGGSKNMPIFDYVCQKCGHTFEVLQKTHQESPPKCPKQDDQGKLCGGDVIRTVSKSSFVLKGGGWAADGYGGGPNA